MGFYAQKQNEVTSKKEQVSNELVITTYYSETIITFPQSLPQIEIVLTTFYSHYYNA